MTGPPVGGVRAVVLSDIHATYGEEEKDDTNVALTTADNVKVNALVAAVDHLRAEVQSADLLLCPGDLVHRKDKEPMQWVWDTLHAAAADLGAVLVGAAGNHDILLEASGGEMPQTGLQALQPYFPHETESSELNYWANGCAVITTDSWRAVTLNSCHTHGGHDRSEADYGRFTERCLTKLAALLEQSPGEPAVNICMVHHHPQEWTDGSDLRVRHLQQGDKLIDLLDGRPERWMLLHGHKHHPALDYVGRGSCGPVRLSAGSVGANLLGESGTTVRNQMHVVDFDPAVAASFGLELAGQVSSFDWKSDDGWMPAAPGSGLPATTGFGFRRDGVELAHWLSSQAHEHDKRSWTLEEIEAIEPRCRYLTPRDRDEFFNAVRRLGGGVIDRPGDNFLEVTFSW